MQPNFSIDELLTPLALAVIIDNKVRDPELSEFVVQAEGLLDLLGLNMAPQDILAWFRDNEPKLISRMNRTGKNTFVLVALTRFKDNDAIVEAMYDAMLAISISDQEYHETESELMKSAASLWGYQRPPFKIVRDKA
ncbi:MAG TPA: hypothetical protein ENJ42_00485 [Hellea balneolensis]|uniref:TerB family tellurite resistance protein n=1 Tax=Hellea balneolensis TaxID=287478 RepID=A0A7C5R705_9PROT|nr:hypothetical protein [Hellea balneolensis]